MKHGEADCIRVLNHGHADVRHDDTHAATQPRSPITDSDLDPVTFAREKLGFDPDTLQTEVLRSAAKRGILNCTRQWGKTTVLATKVVHRLATQPGCMIIVASPGYRQTNEFMTRAEDMVRRLNIPIHRDRQNKHSLVFPNRSRVVGLPHMPDKSRSFSGLSMLVFDEAAFVSDEMYQALLPMLAVKDGDLWMLSTPHGKAGFFYETWQHGGDQWHRISVKATDCPRIPAAFLEEMRSTRGDDYVRQEFLCEFLGSGAHAFDRELVENAFRNSYEPFSPDAFAQTPGSPPAWLTSRPGSRFYIAVDLGKRRDHSAIVIIERDGDLLIVRSVERVALGTPYERVVAMVQQLARSPRLRGRCSIVVDGTGVGEPVVEMMKRADMGCPVRAVVISAGSKPGHATVPKFDLMSGLHLSLEKGDLKFANRLKEGQALVREFLSIRIHDNGSMGADGAGEHDDLVMAVALGCWAAKRRQNDWGGGGSLL